MVVVAVTYPLKWAVLWRADPGALFLWEWKPSSQQHLPEHWRDVPRGAHNVPEGWTKKWSESTWVLVDLSLRLWIYLQNCLLGWYCSSMVDPWPSVHQAPTLIPRSTKIVCLLSGSKMHSFREKSILDLSIKIPSVTWKDLIQQHIWGYAVNEHLVLRNTRTKGSNMVCLFFSLSCK